MTGRGFRFLTSSSEKRRTFERQCSCLPIHSASCSLNAGRSRKRCVVSWKTGGCAVDLRPRLDQIRRIELVAAVVALVAAGLGEAADRARALDVAVGQRLPGRGGERADGRLLDDEALLVERAEDVAHDLVVVLGRRPREQVVREPEPPQVLADDLVVPVGELTRRDALLVGGDHDRRAVLVGAADHEDVVAPQAGGSGRRCPTGRRIPPRGRCAAGRSHTAMRPRRGSSGEQALRSWRSMIRASSSRLLATARRRGGRTAKHPSRQERRRRSPAAQARRCRSRSRRGVRRHGERR